MRQASAHYTRCRHAARAGTAGLCLAVSGCGGGGGGSAPLSTDIQARTAALTSLYESADVVLDWTAPVQRADATALGPLEIKGYQICYVGSDGDIVLIPREGRDDLISETSYTITDLSPDNYQFNVFVIDESNRVSAPSDTVNIQLDQFPLR